MKFSKKLFLSAAVLFGSACVASAATVNGNVKVSVNKQLTEDYYVTEKGTLTLTISQSHTMAGHFYGSSSLVTEGHFAEDLTLGQDYSEDYAGYYDIQGSGGKIEITGGGTLEYKGFSDINYYTGTYLTTHGDPHGTYEQGYTSSLVGIDGNGAVDVDKTAFSGQLTVSGGTTLNVSGYLTQYIRYARPENEYTLERNSPESNTLGYVGISNLVLSDTSKLSFALSDKNLLSKAFDLSNGEVGASVDAVGVRSLNFLHNVKADINTTIEMGKDKASTSRIVIATTGAKAGKDFGWDGETKIGKLAGTGRIYFVSDPLLNEDIDQGNSIVSITNRAEFGTYVGRSGSASGLELNPEYLGAKDPTGDDYVNAVSSYIKTLGETYDLLGNTPENTEEGKILNSGVLADVFLLSETNILGSDSKGTGVVDNVLETATAVQFATYLGDWSSFADFTSYATSEQVNGSAIWETQGIYTDPGRHEAGSVIIQGTQILNNLQSLFAERGTLVAEAEANGEKGFYELSRRYSNANGTDSYADAVSFTASGTSVFVRTGGTLIINQLEDRDGIFQGRFFTSDAEAQDISKAEANDAYIIKTGAGSFVNISSDTVTSAIINRLFVYEGAWVANPAALGGGRVFVGKSGTLRIISNRTESLNARLEGVGKLLLTYGSFYEDENGVTHGGIVNDGREYVVSTTTYSFVGDKGDADNAETLKNFNPERGNIQVSVAQDAFTGSVELDDGMTLTLGVEGANELSSVFSNAESIKLKGDARIVVSSYQILPSLIGEDASSLIFSTDRYDATAVLTKKGDFKGSISGNGSLAWSVYSTDVFETAQITLATSSHTLSTIGLSNRLNLLNEGGLRNSSGLVLVNNATLAADKNQSLGMLVGSAESRLELSGGAMLTVGLSNAATASVVSRINGYYNGGNNGAGKKIVNDGYFFATADSEAYLSDLGLGLDGISNFGNSAAKIAIESLGAVRPDYMHEDENGIQSRDPMTVRETAEYLKDPAKLANVFAHIYATIDAGTFDTLRGATLWRGLGVSGTTLEDAFRDILSLEKIQAFVNSKPENWTQRELDALLGIADDYATNSGDFFENEALTREGYQNFWDANVIKYLSQCGSGLTEEQLTQSETLYGFISLFVDDYKFRLTQANIETIKETYGFEGINAATEAERYAQFENIIGLQYADGELPGFAGTISGTGTTLKKVGGETLRLTGKNTYTGATLVQGGELRVDWDAIASTSDIRVEKGALLTLVSEGKGEYKFKIGARDENNPSVAPGVISGAGTILKDGEGTLVIDAALGYASSDPQDFTGEIVVGKGSLVVNTITRTSFADTVDVYLNDGASFGLKVGTDKTTTEEGETVETPHTLVFKGEVFGGGTSSELMKDGEGKLVFEQGVSLADDQNYFNLAVKAGEMELKFSENCTFRQDSEEAFSAVLGNSATLTFNVADGKELKFAWDVLKGENASETTFVKSGAGSLVLNKEGEAAWTVDALRVDAGTLTIDEHAAYQFSGIETKEGATFRVDGILSVSGKNANVFGGMLTGTGTINVNGSLELSDISFGGMINLAEKSALAINAAENTEKSLDFVLKTANGVSLEKKGLGTVLLTQGVDLTGMSLVISEGTLAFAQQGLDLTLSDVDKISGTGTLSIRTGTATVADAGKIKDFTGTFDVSEGAELAFAQGVSAVGGISGAGTLAFAESKVTLSPNRDLVFSGELATVENATIVIAGTGTQEFAAGTKFAAGAKLEVAGSLAVDKESTVGISLKDKGSLEIVGDVPADQSYANIAFDKGGVAIALQGAVELRKFNELFPQLTEATTVTLANRRGNNLSVNLDGSGMSRIQTANVVLATNAGTLTLETDAAAEYDKDIGGDGSLVKSGIGTLTLSSKTQSYTGATEVAGGTLAFNSGTTLKTSGLLVRDGAALRGGVTLLAENATVDFENGASYKLDVAAGESLVYTGKLEVNGQLTLDVDVGQADRGKAFSIFTYGGVPEAASAITGANLVLNSTTDGEILYIAQEELAQGNLKVYVAQDDFRKTGADLHDGLDGLVDILNEWATPENGKLTVVDEDQIGIADALNKTSLGDLSDAITNLSPLAYASMVTMPHAGFTSDIRAVSSRLEQRLYDSGSAVWIYDQDAEFFAQAQGSTVDGGSDSDSMVYDYNTYGALAGMDIKFNKEATAGFAIAYDHGKADIRGNGGEIESDDIRATVFGGYLINDYLSLNAGAQIGYASYDTERNTVYGKNKGDTNGWHGGVFADLVGACTVAEWGDSAHLDFFPHVGLALSYYRIDKFEERSSTASDRGSALATDSFDALSLQARLGGAFNCVFEIDGHATRLGLDLSLVHEFLDDEVEIESRLVDSKFKTDARALSGTSLSVAPSVSFDLDAKTSLYLNYEFRLGTEAEVAHRANLGCRYRF